MNITNFAKKLAEKPVFKTRIKSDQVKLSEIAIGYFLAPFCAMFANAIFGAYLNRYYVDVLGWTKFGAFATLLPIVSVIFVVLGNLMIGRKQEVQYFSLLITLKRLFTCLRSA